MLARSMSPSRPSAARRLLRLLVALGLAAGCRPAADPRPDLVLISVDTLRPDPLVCYGGDDGVGAALCALGDEGVRFTWAFATAPSTAPSVASLLTSRLPYAHGVTERARSALDPGVATLAERLAEVGYATGAFVANPVLARGRGFERGFAVYDDRMIRPERNRGLLEREAGELTDAALAWARVAPRPRFLWIHYQDPHGPYDPPDAPPAWDAAEAPRLPVLDDHSGWGGIPAYQVLGAVRSAAAYARRYAAEIAWLDRHLARLVTGLDALGPRPAILLTADHGEAFGEDDFWLAHGHSLGVDQIRVPLLWRPARPIEGRVETAPVSTLDVLPTLLAAAGVAVPEDAAGRVLGADAAAPRTIFAEHRLRVAAVAGDRYYARDRVPLPGPVPEPVTGGAIPPLPPRALRLAASGAWSAADYEPAPVGAEPALEAAVAELLAAAAGAPGAGGAASLDPATREALRALGYLE